MKRFAAVIISIVFIFTACGRHALESEAFSTAETENEIFETKERTTGYYAGVAIGVIAAVGITAAVMYKYCCNITTQSESEIEKTYEISVTLSEKYKGRQIYEEIENLEEVKAGKHEVYIDFDLEIDSISLFECSFKVYIKAPLLWLGAFVKEKPIPLIGPYFALMQYINVIEKRNVDIGTIKTSKSIDKLKIRCNNKFIEGLIGIVKTTYY